MCGIWVWVHLQPLEATDYRSLESLSQQVQRRGPDKTVVAVHPHFFMAFHRLAFHDLSPLGDQPLVFFDGDLTTYLVVNGEIYNDKALLHKYSLEVRSDNDCEVIYHLYKLFGNNMEKTVQALDGEFALVMVTVRGDALEEIVVTRDPYGVRPLFYSRSEKGCFRFSSVARGLTRGFLASETNVKPFPPGTVMRVSRDGRQDITTYHSFPEHFLDLGIDVSKILCKLLVDAVGKRVSSERPLACLLSGGLDSSLVCAILVRILGVQNLHTFSIGMEGSTDLAYAQEVASYLGTHHHTVHFTPQEGLDAIDEVVKACETWDITTIRASVGQYLLAKHISEKTEFRAILNGDGADEAMMGYLYWYNAPTRLDAHLESLRRLQEIYLYDGLRVDRCLGHFGLEARVPYLDKAFVDFVLTTPIATRTPSPTQMEKHLVRNAFADHHPDILPQSVLWRKKEAFSDGVSSQKESWFQTVQREMERRVSDTDFYGTPNLGLPEIPPTKEAWYYQKKFLEIFGTSCNNLIPRYWLPKWSGDIKEPSARVLSVYISDNKKKAT
jgi:asparagine synthase (glutamine-hydrolysing)